jgi:hypothetical protein
MPGSTAPERVHIARPSSGVKPIVVSMLRPSRVAQSEQPPPRFRDRFGHTPLSVEEEIPWKCRLLVIGTGTGALPVMEEVNREAHRRKIKLQISPTAEAIKILEKHPERTNAILHLTC